MAAKNLTIATEAGVTEAFTAASAGGDSFPIGSPIILRARNNGAAARTITLVAARPCNHGVLHDKAIVIPNDDVPVAILIQDVSRYQGSGQRIQLTYSSEAGLSLAAFPA